MLESLFTYKTYSGVMAFYSAFMMFFYLDRMHTWGLPRDHWLLQRLWGQLLVFSVTAAAYYPIIKHFVNRNF